MKDFDEEIGDWCELNKIDYTRYSDDMTFSGDFNTTDIIIRVRKMLAKINLELNNQKIHIINHSKSQNVTGIVVNEKAQVGVKYRHKIRQEMYYIKKFGIKSHLSKLNINIIEEQVTVLQINPTDQEFIKYRELVMSKITKF